LPTARTTYTLNRARAWWGSTSVVARSVSVRLPPVAQSSSKCDSSGQSIFAFLPISCDNTERAQKASHGEPRAPCGTFVRLVSWRADACLTVADQVVLSPKRASAVSYRPRFLFLGMV